jgi:hypothetical protein
MFAGEFHAHAEAGGLFRLPPIFLAAFPPPEEAVGRQVVVLKSLDQSLWLSQAQGSEAKLDVTREQLTAEQSRLRIGYRTEEARHLSSQAHWRAQTKGDRQASLAV